MSVEIPALVTIGIPCYNAAATIGRAIASALAQDWPAVEVVVVDDVSTDDSVAVVLAAIGGDRRARLVRHDRNKGPAGARNTVLAGARGEFVVFFDDDDESHPDRVSTQVRRILDYERESGAELVACYASGQRLYPNGYVLPMAAIGSLSGSEPSGQAVANYLLLFRKVSGLFYGAGTPTCALMARRAVFAAIGGFDDTLRRVEDADFAVRLGLAGGHCVGTREVLFDQHATDAPDKSPDKNLEAERALVRKHRAYLSGLGRYEYALRWPELRYWHFRRDHARFIACLLGLLIRHPLPVIRHLLATGPRRLAHERRIRKRRTAAEKG